MEHSSSKLWAITSYFNPAGFRRRRENFHEFRKHLEVPLLAVELGYGGEFELQPSDAEVLIQLKSGDVLWQKERLLNVALAALPRDCEFVAWLDCDVVLEPREWPQAAASALAEQAVIHLFREVYDLSQGERLTEARHRHATGRSVLADRPERSRVPVNTSRLAGTLTGLAWAARREMLAQGFYDACVIGGGDRAMLYAQFGQFDNAIADQEMNEAQTEHYLDWARPHFQLVRGNVGVIDGCIYHLWHGDLRARRYKRRHEVFNRFHFDPHRDIRHNAGGAWVWSSPKKQMHQFLKDYFVSRCEDGVTHRDRMHAPRLADPGGATSSEGAETTQHLGGVGRKPQPIQTATMTAHDSSKLWAITSYFNPAGFRRRLETFREFRRHLDVPLVAVELGYREEFELQRSDAEVLIQLKSGDVLWQKERLLNLALAALPRDCQFVAWLDCDVVFSRRDWPRAAASALAEHAVIHPFRDFCDLSQGERLADARQREASGRSVLVGRPEPSRVPVTIGRLAGTINGLAWAARREALEQGFYDACIVGGGDRAMLYAQFGQFDDTIAYHKMNEAWAEHYLDWARPYFQLVRGNVGFIDGCVYHLWHGDLKGRHGDLRAQYGKRRHEIVAQFRFDPHRDIKLNAEGAWLWSSPKEQMHQFLKDYFASRCEDGGRQVESEHPFTSSRPGGAIGKATA